MACVLVSSPTLSAGAPGVESEGQRWSTCPSVILRQRPDSGSRVHGSLVTLCDGPPWVLQHLARNLHSLSQITSLSRQAELLRHRLGRWLSKCTRDARKQKRSGACRTREEAIRSAASRVVPDDFCTLPVASKNLRDLSTSVYLWTCAPKPLARQHLSRKTNNTRRTSVTETKGIAEKEGGKGKGRPDEEGRG